MEILSVSQLNRSVRDLLEHRFPLLWVRGEISNFMLAKSGHAYFSLKDSQAQIRCAMFRNRFQHVDWRPSNGMQVEVQGLVTLYEPRGDYQLVIDSMRRSGIGELYEKFVRLRDKLTKEGLFEEATKRPLPTYPRSVGIVTSLAAAALRDVLTTLNRRNPSIRVVIYPATVQGESAAREIVSAIESASIRKECDVLLVCRGGGSIEDLWSFNDEGVARAIRACSIPVVTGIGHETDFCIADFVADRRAPTPTAAAELASNLRSEILTNLSWLVQRLSRRTARRLEISAQRIDASLRRLVHPARRIEERREKLEHFSFRLARAAASDLERRNWRWRALNHRAQSHAPRIEMLMDSIIAARERLQTVWEQGRKERHLHLEKLRTSLEHLNPQRVLERGFILVRDSVSGRIIRSARDLIIDQQVELTFAQGRSSAKIVSTDVD